MPNIILKRVWLFNAFSYIVERNEFNILGCEVVQDHYAHLPILINS
jgi:hypothetical protein